MEPKIALIHATQVSIEPINHAFTQLWPEARLANLLDDSLSVDLLKLGQQTPELMERFLKICQYAVDFGADAILFNCSSFGKSIDYCKEHIKRPIYKPNEAMIEDALELSLNIGLIASFEPAIESIRGEMVEYAEDLGKMINFQSVLCPEALEQLRAGHFDEHDKIIAREAGKLDKADVVCFAQFSMSSAAALTRELTGKPVLTTPDSAVRKIHKRFNPPVRNI